MCCRAVLTTSRVYNVGQDGHPELVEVSSPDNTMSKATEIWHSIRVSRVSGDQQHRLKDAGHWKEQRQADCWSYHVRAMSKRALGALLTCRSVAREPSPILFGALHLTLHNAFDMDELFRHLVRTEASASHMFRAFTEDPRHQRTFFFTFEYYTIIGDDCKPMQWQRADKVTSSSDSHIPLSRCGAVVALALFDESPRRVRNRARRSKTNYGFVSDPWSPYQVLQLECFPDWKSTPINGNPYTFESGHRYLNGPEAFLHALLTEYRDARKRYDEIYKQITELVTPPLGFLFDEEARRKRLFEDKNFTWTRRYFYAHQALGNVNDSIKAMIDAFEDTFTEDVWDGESKTLWPLYDESPRNEHWKRKLRLLRLQFEREMKELRILQRENNERRHEIETLQEQLFSGTSIQESRKSVELADVTVHQGYNIKVLTIVNLFFMVSHSQSSLFLTDSQLSTYFCDFHLRHDQYACRTCSVLAIRNHTGRNLYTLLQHHRFPFHQVWLPRLGNQNTAILALAPSESKSRRRDRDRVHRASEEAPEHVYGRGHAYEDTRQGTTTEAQSSQTTTEPSTHPSHGSTHG